MFICSIIVTMFLHCYYLIFVVFSSNNLYLSRFYLYSFLCCCNFLTGIIKVRSYLIKFLFICCGKCESFVEAQSCAVLCSQKLVAGFHSVCRLLIILSCPLVSVNGERIAVRWVILHGVCINDAEKLKSW